MSYYVRIEKVDSDTPIAGATFYYDYGDDPDQRYVVTGPIVTPAQIIDGLCNEWDDWESYPNLRSFREMATDAVTKAVSLDVEGWEFPPTDKQTYPDIIPYPATVHYDDEPGMQP